MKTSQVSQLLSLISMRIAIFLLLVCAVTATTLPAQTFTSLASFNGTNGQFPFSSSVVQGRDGLLYGTTSSGGANSGCGHGGCGTFFQFNPSTQQLTVLYSFCALQNCADGANPQAGVVLGTNGNFYGTTAFGGSTTQACFAGIVGCGTVFEITPAGTLTTLFVFSGPDGGDPQGGLVQATNGNFYGTTLTGGTNNDGTVFVMTPAGTLTTLHSFDGSDGRNPQSGVIQAVNGNFYGTTFAGGTRDAGTVFQMTPGGTLTTLHSFNGFDGVFANGLVQATDGNLYGTTEGGGTSTACRGGSCGTVFRLTLNGTLTTLHSFDGGADGADPIAGLIEAADKNLYGTTAAGGANKLSACDNLGCGTIFAITTGGTLTTLHSFGVDGFSAGVGARLLEATPGIFYGTTNEGGAFGVGTVYKLTLTPGTAGLATATRYTGETTQNYHDLTSLSASLVVQGTSVPISGQTITFTLGTQSCAGTTSTSGVAACSITLNQVPGSYTVKASFAGTANNQASSDSKGFTITSEETATTYTGPTVIANGVNTTFSAVLKEDGTAAIAGRTITITLGSGSTAQTCNGITDATGTVSCSILVNQPLGPGTVAANFAGDALYLPSSSGAATILFAFPSQGAFVVGDQTASGAVEFWGDDWATANLLTGGPAPDAFKGFANGTSEPPACGRAWTTNPGNSSQPPDSPLPSFMGVVVSTTVSKSGSIISGDTSKIIVVTPNAGYEPNPGHHGTGMVVATFCTTGGPTSGSMAGSWDFTVITGSTPHPVAVEAILTQDSSGNISGTGVVTAAGPAGNVFQADLIGSSLSNVFDMAVDLLGDTCDTDNGSRSLTGTINSSNQVTLNFDVGGSFTVTINGTLNPSAVPPFSAFSGSGTVAGPGCNTNGQTDPFTGVRASSLAGSYSGVSASNNTQIITLNLTEDAKGNIGGNGADSTNGNFTITGNAVANAFSATLMFSSSNNVSVFGYYDPQLGLKGSILLTRFEGNATCSDGLPSRNGSCLIAILARQ